MVFKLAAEFDLYTSVGWQDKRFDYGEDRYLAIGFLRERLHVLIYRLTEAGVLRVISLRKANKK